MRGFLALAASAIVLGGLYAYLFVPSAGGYGYPRPSSGPSFLYFGGPGVFYGPRSSTGVGRGVGAPSTRAGSLGGPGFGGSIGGGRGFGGGGFGRGK